MAKTRREFSPEFKQEAVALLESSGRPLMQVATEVGISPSMLRNWRAVVHAGTGRDGTLASNDVDGFAAAVARGPGVGDHAVEA